MTWKDILKAKKPDFIDLDGDGNTTEPMSEAAKDVEKQTGKFNVVQNQKIGEVYDEIVERYNKPVEDEIDREQVIAEVQGWINKYDWSPWNRDSKLLPPRIYFGKNNRGGAILKDGKRIYYTFGRNQLTLGELTGTKDLKISPSFKMAIGTAEETLRKLHSALKGDNQI